MGLRIHTGYNPKPFHYSRVISNSALKGENYVRIGSSSILFRFSRSSRTYPVGKTHKNPERERDSRRGLQRRIMHCSKTLYKGKTKQATSIVNQKHSNSPQTLIPY